MSKLRWQICCGITAMLPLCIDPLRSLRGKQVSRVGCRDSTELLHWFLCEYIQTLQSHCENVRLLSEILKSELATHVFCNNAFVLSTQGIFFASLMCVVQYETVRLWLIFYGHINFYTFLKLLVIISRWSEDTCKFEAHLASRPFQWGDNSIDATVRLTSFLSKQAF